MSESLEKTMRMRTYVLKEILKTEKDYVETLKFLVQVFMERLKCREDDENDKLVPTGTVGLLLANVEELYEFHQTMLKSIEEILSPEPNYSHEIGKAFLKHKSEFQKYEPYCTNHERAQKRLNELTENQEFQGFILGVLLLGNYVNDVSMEGFLLTPIQRICKYPLLLRELLKKTPSNHADYDDVKEACEMMKSVCTNVNETKRQLEHLEKLEEIQASIANWEGVNLTDVCTKLIKQGPLLKISVGNFQERQFFLFDHLLVYAKKVNNLPRLQSTADSKTATIRRAGRSNKQKSSRDLQKKWIFKGRISTELMEIENLEDGASDYHCGGSSVTNAWKVLNAAKNKWFVLIAKDKEEKESWLNEFIMEREKRKSKVNMDQRDSIDVTHAKGKKLYFRLTHQNIIRDRKHKMRTHPKSFPGNELVTWLVENKESPSNDEAVLFGQALLDCGLIHHVSDKHHFRNESILYRFRYDDGTFKTRGENQDIVAKGLRVYYRLHSLFQPVIRDKEKNWKSHKYVVEGKKLIDWLVDQGDCQNRDEASNFGQTLCENAVLHHASDRQDFKDDNSLFRFYPDEDTIDSKIKDISKKSSAKSEFRMQEEYLTKTLLLMNVSESENLGIELKFCEEKSSVVVSSVKKDSQGQMQGFKVGMEVIQINSIIVTSCPSEEVLKHVMKYNLDHYKLMHFVVKVESEEYITIPVTDKGMGFQIKGSNPCVVHNVCVGGAAMNNGLHKGHAIFKINDKVVTKLPHDEVAAAIRDGCKPRPENNDNEEDGKKSEDQEEEGKTGSGNLLSTPSAVRRVKSFKKSKNKTGKDKKTSNPTASPTEKGLRIELVVGNRHLERTCIYNFTNVNGAKTYVSEKMSETPSIFDLAAQLIDVLAEEDTKVLSDVQRLDIIASQIAEVKREVFERRKSLRFEVIQNRLEEYKKYKRHLISFMWPSYKMARDRMLTRPSAKDFCPTNCHVNLMTVSHPTERSHLKGFGLQDSKGENEMLDGNNLVSTTNSITCAAAPSFRTKGPGLNAVLRGAEGNTDLMDNVRHLMVALDSSLLELKQGQKLLTSILYSEAAERDKRNSLQSVRNSYQDGSELFSPLLLSPGSNPIPEESQRDSMLSPIKSPSPILIPQMKDIVNGNTAAESQDQKNSPKENTPEEELIVKGDRKNLSLDLGPTNTSTPSQTGVEELDSATGHESECDSGIHSNRGSLVDNEKLAFSFPNANHGENNNDNQDGDDKTNRTSGISTTNSSDRLSISDDHKTIKGANSMPSLSTPPPSGNNNSSPSTRSPKKRPKSGRQRLSYLSAAGSTCSSEGVESLAFPDLDLSADGIDKLHGTMEHFMTKIQNLGEQVKSDIVKTVFESTKETTPERDYNKIIDGFNVSTGLDAIKMSLAVCNDVKQVADVIKTVIDSVEEHVNEIRTQLVLAVLLNEDPKLVSRRDKVFCQALITAISSFSTQLRCALAGTFNNMKAYGVRPEDASRKWLDQCMSIGVCVVFQTMLNLNETDELAMLDDSSVGVNDLERVSFHFKAITEKVEANECPFNVNNNFDGTSPVSIDVNGVGYSIEGNRCALKVYFHLEKHVFIKLPPRLQAGGGVKLVPILVNHGLSDLGESLYEQEVTLQAFSDSLNEKGYDKMYDYYKRFRAFHFDRSKLPRDTEARAVLVDKLSRPLNALDEVVTLLESNVKPRHRKNILTTSGCGLLSLSSEYCQRVGACSVAACRNGTQRSSSSCALQQAFSLATCHGLPPKHTLSAAYQMCKIGARSYTETKNPETYVRFQNNTPRLFRLFFEPTEVKTAS